MGSPLTLLFLHIPVAFLVQIRGIQTSKDIWDGLFYGLPTVIDIYPHFNGLLRSKPGNSCHKGHLEWPFLLAPPLEVKTGKFRPPRTFGMEFPMGLWAPHWHCYFSILQWPLEVKTGKFRPPRTFGMEFSFGLWAP